MLLRSATDGDRAAVDALLGQAGLPTDGVANHFGSFVVAEDGARIVGAVGMEVYGFDALLRSVVVAADARGAGLGSALTRRALAEATRQGLATVYLLTTTAPLFFLRFGFERVERSAVPPMVQQSREFHGACPSSAIAMRMTLKQAPGPL